MTLPAGLIAYELSAVTADGIDFTSVASTTAYKPYLVRNTTDAPVTLSINAVQGNVELARAGVDMKNSVGNVDFIGNFQQFRVTGDEGYAAFRTSGQMAWLSNAGTTVGSFRAYLAGLTSAQMARGITVDGVTSIIQSSLTPQSSDMWFSLDGRRISGRPTVKGVYINNGKKVVVK